MNVSFFWIHPVQLNSNLAMRSSLQLCERLELSWIDNLLCAYTRARYPFSFSYLFCLPFTAFFLQFIPTFSPYPDFNQISRSGHTKLKKKEWLMSQMPIRQCCLIMMKGARIMSVLLSPTLRSIGNKFQFNCHSKWIKAGGSGNKIKTIPNCITKILWDLGIRSYMLFDSFAILFISQFKMPWFRCFKL